MPLLCREQRESSTDPITRNGQAAAAAMELALAADWGHKMNNNKNNNLNYNKNHNETRLTGWRRRRHTQGWRSIEFVCLSLSERTGSSWFC